MVRRYTIDLPHPLYPTTTTTTRPGRPQVGKEGWQVWVDTTRRRGEDMDFGCLGPGEIDLSWGEGRRGVVVVQEPSGWVGE
ncbi:hypothetical protein Pmani_017910 [Petrolisthes manimaculis]|uniref:Uncharacterized protein n=1 Tax=Petrolisthes manimaculis TaxID=1843537 RepID=A0AAE1U9B5_9EUCA|nr:hypothetical protein Pmani_017910 [Petrolisthes manimaculis]